LIGYSAFQPTSGDFAKRGGALILS